MTDIVPKINENIKINGDKIRHSKASEVYIPVTFIYSNIYQEWWIPIEYRRTGLHLRTDAEIVEYLNLIYENLNPNNYSKWSREQKKFWDTKPRARITKGYFDALKSNKWTCVSCGLPTGPNWARRIQDLKEFGYTLATNTNRMCKKCGENKTHVLMIPLTRGSLTGNGYETWSPVLRKKILKVLEHKDVYEVNTNAHILPDHKFPEIRWDEKTLSENDNNMSDIEIKQKFQLLSNQRNQQKREACRKCYQTGERGIIYGIPFYYEGNGRWDEEVPVKGKEAEVGCKGCPWYDIEEWRQHLLTKLGIHK